MVTEGLATNGLRSILVSGATGSFGTAYIDYLLRRTSVERICGLSRCELKQSQLAERFNHDPRLRLFLGDVRDRPRLEQAFHGIDAVVHAAALKRVDAAAYDPQEAVKTNVIGTDNVIQAAISAGVRKVVVLSSDKSVRATNHYGATKFLAEQLAIASNVYGYPRGTVISAVRYGNVLGSRGSVLHLWREAVAHDRPIPLTHPDMSRFWMSITQAVELVNTALSRMQGGEVFIPKLPALTLRELAALVGGASYPVTLTGLRPGGEKLHEELLSPEEVSRTHDAGDVYVIAPSVAPWRKESPDYGPLVSPDFEYRSDNAPKVDGDRMRQMLEAA